MSIDKCSSRRSVMATLGCGRSPRQVRFVIESQRTGKLTHAARRFYGGCGGSASSRLDSASVSFGKLNSKPSSFSRFEITYLP